MKKLLQLLFAAALLLLPTLSTLQAQTNLSVQGTIQNFNGSAVDNGEYDVIFKLYTTDAGGTALWSETQSVTVTGGVYSVLLGAVNSLMVPFDQTYYLGITLPGGPELTPRSRLTSAPYSLAVVGQTNIFPSTGAVGIGTATPTAGNELHVKDDAAAAQILVEGVTGSEIKLKKGANSASITYDGANINVQNLNLSSYSPAELVVTSRMAVGQGSVDPNYGLKVVGKTYLNGFVEMSGASSYTAQGNNFMNVSCCSSNYHNGSGPISFGLRVNARIQGAEIWLYSDRRIKTGFHLSDKSNDLSTLQKLRVTDYSHIDVIAKGNAVKKGFIAQEVKEVFPEAVTIISDFIPNVYTFSKDAKLAAGQLTVSLDKNHEFAVGDEVKLELEQGSKKAIVTAVPTPTTFSVAWDEANAPTEKIFVLGKKVNDFHSVDYDRIFTLNVSATQELARRVEQLEAENSQLREHNNGLQQKTDRLQLQNEELRSDLNGLGERLLKLEKRGGSLEK